MSGDLIPRALEMAREIRRGEAQHAPHALYAASLGRADIYRHAMLEAGYVVPTDTNQAPAVCEVCGYDFGASMPRQPIPNQVEMVARCTRCSREIPRLHDDWCARCAADPLRDFKRLQ